MKKQIKNYSNAGIQKRIQSLQLTKTWKTLKEEMGYPSKGSSYPDLKSDTLIAKTDQNKLNQFAGKLKSVTISLSRHEQVCLARLRFERYPSHNRDGRSISRNIASLNILVHDVINLLYYEH